MNELEDAVGLSTSRFVERYVRSLLTWDVLVFFHRNRDAVLDVDGLAARLGRRVEEVRPEIDELCRDRILQCAGGLVRYRPEPSVDGMVDGFVAACGSRSSRLALIALVLHKISPESN